MYKRIEFMGLPGAGKTTLASILRKEIKQCNFKVMPADEAIAHCIRRRDDGIIRNLAKKFPPIVWEPLCGMRNALSELHIFASENVDLFKNIFNSLNNRQMSVIYRQCILYTFFQIFSEHELLSRMLNEHDIIFSEEGFVQAGSMLFGYLPDQTIPTDDIEEFVKCLPRLHMIVWIDTLPEICLSRLKKRPELPIVLQKNNDMEVLSFLRQGNRCMEYLYKFSNKKEVMVRKVMNPKGRIDETAAALKMMIQEMA